MLYTVQGRPMPTNTMCSRFENGPELRVLVQGGGDDSPLPRNARATVPVTVLSSGRS